MSKRISEQSGIQLNICLALALRPIYANLMAPLPAIAVIAGRVELHNCIAKHVIDYTDPLLFTRYLLHRVDLLQRYAGQWRASPINREHHSHVAGGYTAMEAVARMYAATVLGWNAPLPPEVEDLLL